jgi:hypothetical protein
MWLTMLVVGCGSYGYPSAFDWKIDRTKVVAVSVWPIQADASVPRQVDALVLSPHRVESVQVEICGLSEDQPVAIDSAACFSEPGLVDPVPGELPLVWTPDPLGFECTGTVINGSTGYSDSYYEGTEDTSVDTGLDSGLPFVPPPTCGSYFPLRIHARTAEDEASAMTVVLLYTDPYDPREAEAESDPTTADPRLEVVEGEVVAGGRVLLRFEVGTGFSGRYAWYADDGVFWGTGRTGDAGHLRPEGRVYAQNYLEIPEDWHGDLTVAVVASSQSYRSQTQVWATTTLEVP